MTHAQTRFLFSTILIWVACTLSCKIFNQSNLINNTHSSFPQYWLRTSLYAGPFWDNKRQVLVDHRVFSSIIDAKTLDGYTIYPPKSDHIIKAGTLVKIINISTPSNNNKFKRPIFTPRDNILVYFKVAKERGLVNIFDEKLHIMVIPKEIQSESSLKKYLANFFTQTDPNIELLGLQKFIQSAIWLKRPALGMSQANLLSSLGPPLKTENQGQRFLWYYHDYFIVLENNIITKIKSLI